MIHATYNTVAVTLAAGDQGDLFRANGQTLVNRDFWLSIRKGVTRSQARMTRSWSCRRWKSGTC